MHMSKRLVQVWAAAAIVGINGDSGAIFEPSRYHRKLQTCGDALVACTDEVETDGGIVGCQACSLVLYQCQEDYPLDEQPGLCYPCGIYTSEDDILDFYLRFCGGDGDVLTAKTEEFILECFHFGGLETSKCSSDSTTSEDESTTSEDEFTTSEDEFTTSEDEFTTSEDEFTTSEDELTTSEDELTTSEDELNTSEDEFTTSADELNTPEEDPATTANDNGGALTARISGVVTGLSATVGVVLSSATFGLVLV